MAISIIDSPTPAQAEMGRGCPHHGESQEGLPPHHPSGVSAEHAWGREPHSIIGVSPPSHSTSHIPPGAAHITQGGRRPHGCHIPAPHPHPTGRWYPDTPSLTAEPKAEREDVPPKPSEPSNSSCHTSPPLISNVAQVDLELLGCT